MTWIINSWVLLKRAKMVMNLEHEEHESSLNPSAAETGFTVTSWRLKSVTGRSTVCSTACLGYSQRTTRLRFTGPLVRGIHRWPVDSPHKGPVMQKTFSFDVIMEYCWRTMSTPCPVTSAVLTMQYKHILVIYEEGFDYLSYISRNEIKFKHISCYQNNSSTMRV